MRKQNLSIRNILFSAAKKTKLFIFLLIAGSMLSPSAQATLVDSNEKNGLTLLYISTNGWSWKNTWNFTTDPCDSHWYGISCDYKGEHVTDIVLNDNNLRGSLPRDLFTTYLTKIENFYAPENFLNGPLPEISGLKYLHSFIVFENQFSGSIPSLTGLDSLLFFVVSDNQLTGSFPDLHGTPKLAEFNVSNNKLSGTIPENSLISTPDLGYFAIDHNLFSGYVPTPVIGLFSAPGVGSTNAILCPNQFTHPTPVGPGRYGVDEAWNLIARWWWGGDSYTKNPWWAGYASDGSDACVP